MICCSNDSKYCWWAGGVNILVALAALLIFLALRLKRVKERIEARQASAE